jgi:hypothetical protein
MSPLVNNGPRGYLLATFFSVAELAGRGSAIEFYFTIVRHHRDDLIL